MRFKQTVSNSRRTSLNTGSRQQGATLIVSLVILTVVTLIGVASMTETRTQSSIVLNDQLLTAAYNAALTEINAQLDVINFDIKANPLDLDDEIVLDLLDAADGIIEPEVLYPDIVGSDYGLGFAQTLEMELFSAEGYAPSGYSIAPDSSFRMLQFEYRSIVEIEGTGTRSSQVQGARYLAAN